MEQAHTSNGYSIAEILLVFGIIAGVLIGVWAMYTMLSDESEAQMAITEIQMLQRAAVDYKTESGTNSYTDIDSEGFEVLKPYLGQSGLRDGQNIFSEAIELSSGAWTAGHLRAKYPGIPSMDICRKIINHFGEVGSTGQGEGEQFYVVSGKALAGYRGGHPDIGLMPTLCQQSPDGRAEMYIGIE